MVPGVTDAAVCVVSIGRVRSVILEGSGYQIEHACGLTRDRMEGFSHSFHSGQWIVRIQETGLSLVKSLLY